MNIWIKPFQDMSLPAHPVVIFAAQQEFMQPLLKLNIYLRAYQRGLLLK
jgi:hypothetical protein